MIKILTVKNKCFSRRAGDTRVATGRGDFVGLSRRGLACLASARIPGQLAPGLYTLK